MPPPPELLEDAVMRDGLADESVGVRYGAPIYGVAILESESDPVNGQGLTLQNLSVAYSSRILGAVVISNLSAAWNSTVQKSIREAAAEK